MIRLRIGVPVTLAELPEASKLLEDEPRRRALFITIPGGGAVEVYLSEHPAPLSSADAFRFSGFWSFRQPWIPQNALWAGRVLAAGLQMQVMECLEE